MKIFKKYLKKEIINNKTFYSFLEIIELITKEIKVGEDFSNIVEDYARKNTFLEDKNTLQEHIDICFSLEKHNQNLDKQSIFINVNADYYDDYKYSVRKVFLYNLLSAVDLKIEKEKEKEEKEGKEKILLAKQTYELQKYLTLLSSKNLILYLTNFERQNTIYEAFKKADKEWLTYFDGKKFNDQYKGDKLELLQLRNCKGEIYERFIDLKKQNKG